MKPFNHDLKQNKSSYKSSEVEAKWPHFAKASWGKQGYDPNKIEQYWQKKWEKEKTFSPDLDKAKNLPAGRQGPFYNLMMFPYPSAEGMHVGNMYAHTGSDIYGRFMRMQGYTVFEPIGLDGFGIHSENYALKVGRHPMEQAEVSEKNFYRQMHSTGSAFDWERTLETYDPEYYKWTQWLFTQMFKAGLAYRKKATVNFCPSCKTVLADEQVIQGQCERCGSVVEKRELEQWFFKITDYAERLLSNIEKIDWTEKIKIAQRQWIGKSTGAKISFSIANFMLENGEKPNFVLLHGYGGTPEKNFFPWVKETLEAQGFNVQTPLLPDTENPTENKQVKYILKNINIDQNTVLFGHSLGSVVAMKVVERLSHPIAGLVLSGTFSRPNFIDHPRPFENTFNWEFDKDAIRKNAGFIKVVHDLGDRAVPYKEAKIVAEMMGVEMIEVVARAEHFDEKIEPDILDALLPSIKVFTTRPDTLFGATFMVLAPEHPIVAKLLNSELPLGPELGVEGRVESSELEELTKYIKTSQSRTDQERAEEGKEKSGVFSGLYAINPASGEKIPVWVADYVLMGYGTGAIMAVPGHDQRDFEFAKRHSLPIKQVIAQETGVSKSDEQRRDGGCGVVFDPHTQKYAVATSHDGLVRLFAGGVDDNEDLEKGTLREITEESGLYDFEQVERIETSFSHFYNRRKKLNRSALATCFLVILKSAKLKERKLEPHELNLNLTWMDPSEIIQNWTEQNKDGWLDHWILFMKNSVARAIELGYDKTNDPKEFTLSSYNGYGVIINSDQWNGLRVPDEMGKILDDLEEKGIGKREVNYHLRDWLISRQRYWGPPIPMIYCGSCARSGKSWFDTKEARQIKNSTASDAAGWYPVSDVDLPVKLPKIDNYKPLGTGEAPLASYPDFYNVKCPECGSDARRETDVTDPFLDSAWYFLRYLATDWQDIPFPSEKYIKDQAQIKNLKFKIENSRKRSRYLPVHMYIGGAEHAVLHLLYARFVTMVLQNLGYLDFEEPFTRFFAHGLLIKEGSKMSKSKGNVVIPDQYISKYGADTLRAYLMFLGPFSQGGDFYDTGIEGMHKFLKRVWSLVVSCLSLDMDLTKDQSPETKDRLKMMHKTIKEVTQDMESLSYNTALAKLMEWYNFLSLRLKVKNEKLSWEEVKTFLKLLAPFAPHMTEELYQKLKINSQFDSIHHSSWPVYDEKYLTTDTHTVVIQVNGKRRGEIQIGQDMLNDKTSVEKRAQDTASKYLQGKQIVKVVYVPGKILNFVTE